MNTHQVQYEESVPARFDANYVTKFDEMEWLPGSEATLFGQLYRQRILATTAVARRLPPQSRIVDLGCAQGNLARELANSGYSVTAVEVNPAFLNYARMKDTEDRVTWVCSDIRNFAPADRFDAAILTEVIEHTGRPHELLEAVIRLLRPGGLLVLTTPNGGRIRTNLPTFTQWLALPGSNIDESFGPAGEHHKFAFTKNELLGLLANRFTDIRFRAISSILHNMLAAPLLRWKAGRKMIDSVEAALLATPLRPYVANQWLVSAQLCQA